MHVINGVQHLVSEKSARVFSHRSHELTEVKEKPALDELHHDVDKISDGATAGLEYFACVAEVEHSDNAGVFQTLQNGDFVLYRQNSLVVPLEKLVAHDFNCHQELRVGEAAAQVHLGGVAFSKGLDDLELRIEDGVLLWLRVCVLHETDDAFVLSETYY